MLQLREAAERYLPLEPLVRDTLSAHCWDAPPIAVNLSEAARGLPNNPTWAQGLSDIISKLNSSSLQKAPVQKLVYKELMSKRFGNALNDTFTRRLTSLFDPHELDFQQTILLDRCWATLK